MKVRLGDGNFRRMPSVDDDLDWRASILADVMAMEEPERRFRKRRKRTPQMEEFAAGGRFYRRRARIS